jgi:hypothetical protein
LASLPPELREDALLRADEAFLSTVSSLLLCLFSSVSSPLSLLLYLISSVSSHLFCLIFLPLFPRFVGHFSFLSFPLLLILHSTVSSSLFVCLSASTCLLIRPPAFLLTCLPVPVYTPCGSSQLHVTLLLLCCVPAMLVLCPLSCVSCPFHFLSFISNSISISISIEEIYLNPSSSNCFISIRAIFIRAPLSEFIYCSFSIRAPLSLRLSLSLSVSISFSSCWLVCLFLCLSSPLFN